MNILKFFFNKNCLLAVMLGVISSGTILSMDPPTGEIEDIFLPANSLLRSHQYVFVRTNDEVIVRLERWQISQMKTLIVLLEHQQGQNSYENPINAPMVNSDELEMLKLALQASAEQRFEQHFMTLARDDGLLDEVQGKVSKITYTLGEGRLALLVNAAEKVEAQGIVALCGSYYLPPEIQKLLVSNIISPVIEFLKDRLAGFAQENVLSIGSELHGNKAQCCAFSHDSKNIYVGFDIGKIEVWELSSAKLLKSFGTNELKKVDCIALNSDNTMCAAALRTPTSTEIAIWDTSSGELIHTYPDTIGGDLIKSMAFNPLDNKQIVFGYVGQAHGHLPSYVFYLNIEDGSTTPLTGYNNGVNVLYFSPDGTKILGRPWRFLDDVALWNGSSRNLIQAIRPHFASYCTSATFYGNSNTIMMAGASHLDRGTLIVEIGGISNNNYVTEKSVACDHFFNPKKHSFNKWGFIAQPSCDATKVALCSAYDLNWLGNEQDSLLYICKNDFTSILFKSYLSNTGILTIEWCPNDEWIAAVTAEDKILLFPLILEKNKIILDKLQNLSVIQARSLYQLCCGILAGLSLGIRETEKDNAVFMELPSEIREFLLRCLPNKRPICREDECVIL